MKSYRVLFLFKKKKEKFYFSIFFIFFTFSQFEEGHVGL